MSGIDFNKRLNSVIPGGAHTYSRGMDQFPSNAPALLRRGKGAYVWDHQDNKYLDYGMALRAITLGYARDEVNQRAFEEIEKGNNLTRPSEVELEAAELLVDLVGADMVKFAKNGSTVTSAAVKLARAHTGRTRVLRCAEQPFFSYDDWFIGSTVMTKGVPEEIARLTSSFKYGDFEGLKKLIDAHRDEIACVIMEPSTMAHPPEGYLNKVAEACRAAGIVFILDEMITGFRWDLKGAQSYYGVTPDLSTFGKAMANGFSVAALTGRREIMELGGITEPGQERVFLASSTHGAEMSSLGAFVATMDIYKKENTVQSLWSYGEKLIEEGNALSRELGLLDFFHFGGLGCSPGYTTFDRSGKPSFELRTLFSQEMIKSQVLMPWVSLCSAHGETEFQITMDALRKSLSVYAKALESGVEDFLVGPAIKPVFRPVN